MAQRATTTFTDDIDGSEAERTFPFAVDGTHYEIDLSTQNIKEFNEAIAGFVESTRKVKATSSGGVKSDREQTRAVRQWARQQGHQINDRGRTPSHIQQTFDLTHATPGS